MASLSSYRSSIKSIQRGSSTVTIPGNSTAATITSVDTAKSKVSFLGYQFAGLALASSDVRSHSSVLLTNSTTVTSSRSANSDNVSNIVSWEVIEYY